MELKNDDCMQASLIPGLDNDVALLCLARIPYVSQRAICRVCRSWRQVFGSVSFQELRKNMCLQEELLCLDFGVHDVSTEGKHQRFLKFGLWDVKNHCGIGLPPLSVRHASGVPDKERGFTGYRVISMGAKVLVIGGRFPGEEQPLSHIWVFDLLLYKWGQMPSLPVPRVWCAAAVLGSQLIVAGSDFDRSCVSLDLKSGLWQSIDSMPGFSAPEYSGVAFNGEMYVVAQASSTRKVTQKFDPATGLWTTVTGFWPAAGSRRACQSMAIIGSSLFGIFNDHGLNDEEVQVMRYRPEDSRWENFASLPRLPEKMSRYSTGSCMVALGGHLNILEFVYEPTSLKENNLRIGTVLHVLENVEESLSPKEVQGPTLDEAPPASKKPIWTVSSMHVANKGINVGGCIALCV